MVNNLDIAEERFNQYLPTLREQFPKARNNKEQLKQLVETYQEVAFSDNVVVLLFDNRNVCLFFASKNFKKIAGYKPETVLKWGSLFLFRAIHYSHYSYVYNALKCDAIFYKKISAEDRINSRFFCCGLKLVDANGRIRRAFLKTKILIADENNIQELSIIFGEDVTHLIKGDSYWLRYTSPTASYVYVHQKGKKNFSDLISGSEIKILRLITEKKSNAEIAKELYLSKLTVETHRRNMIKRTGAVNSTALVHLCKMADII